MAEGRDYSNYEILLRWSLGNQLAQMGKNKQATEINQRLVLVKMVGLPGLEPGMTESKSGVLPLHHRALISLSAGLLVSYVSDGVQSLLCGVMFCYSEM